VSGEFRCGLVALVGRPNVGKSTLLNHLVGQKISITSRKPQTTRHRIHGVRTAADYQIVFVDTPGLHAARDKAINRYMNRAARAAVTDVDVIVMVVEAGRWTEADDRVLSVLQKSPAPRLLALNKVDLLENPRQLLPALDEASRRASFAALVPVSALRHQQLEALESEIVARLPEAPPMFPEDQVTDRSLRFLAAEIVREKLVRQLGEELPHASAVMVEEYAVERGVSHISVAILVERPGQKAIVIGRGGQRLKRIGEAARKDIERLVDGRVMLRLWVRVRSGWSDDQRALKSLGYED
jgi:GTP-binding protein Era